MFLKRLGAALAASVVFAVPAKARVDPGTPALLRLIDEYGGTVVYNSAACKSGEFHGSYVPATKTITLCYQGTPGATAHDTVRHEVAHFIQHCAAIKRGQRSLFPIADDEYARSAWIDETLPSRLKATILKVYKPEHHQIELEAFAMARHYSAAQMGGFVRQWCDRT